jgi:hypothetical protein
MQPIGSGGDADALTLLFTLVRKAEYSRDAPDTVFAGYPAGRIFETGPISGFDRIFGLTTIFFGKTSNISKL